MTSISRHPAASWSSWTTAPIACSSFIAGMTIETAIASAKQLLHDTVPGDRLRPATSCRPEPRRQPFVGAEVTDRSCDDVRHGRAHESILAVDDEFERSARIGGGDHRLAAQKRFKCHVA